MIEAEGIKIAESSDEAFWTEFKTGRLKDIETNKREIIINEELVKLAEQKLSEVNKNGK